MIVPWCFLMAFKLSVRAARCAIVSRPRYRTLVSFELMNLANRTAAVFTSGEFVSIWMARLIASKSTACCALLCWTFLEGSLQLFMTVCRTSWSMVCIVGSSTRANVRY